MEHSSGEDTHGSPPGRTGFVGIEVLLPPLTGLEAVVRELLLVEDNPGDARLISVALGDAPGATRFNLTHVDRLSAALKQLDARDFDAALLNLGLPDASGLDALVRLRSRAPKLPIVVLTGRDDDAFAAQTLHAGAQDYLVKGRVEDETLRRAIRYAIERKRTEEALARSSLQILALKTEIEGILTSLGDGMMQADASGTITLIDDTARRMLGIDGARALAGQAEGVFWPNVTRNGIPVAPGDLPLTRALAGQRELPRELEISVFGESRILSVAAGPLTGADGALLGAVAVLRDITRERRRQARAEESERLRTLGEMASGIAHDFNNMLAVIMGRCELLTTMVPAATDRRSVASHLDVIKQAARDGEETVKRLQTFSGISRRPSTGVMDIGAIVREVVEFTRPRWRDEAQQRGVTVKVEAESEPLPPLVGNPAELREVLVNMVFNAVDAMPQGGTVRLLAQRAGERLRIQVVDTGLGMPEAVRRRVFEPFFSTKGTRGTGLGLSMAYGIIARMGGEIGVTSVPNAGTAFTIALPYAVAEPEAAERATAETRALSILLVDDEPQILQTTLLLLEVDGHHVTSAESGAEALAALGAAPESYDVVLTDLGMPRMNGLQMVAAIRAAGHQLPCVLVTGWGVQLNSEEIAAAGAQAVLPKPFALAELRAVLASL